MQERCIRLPRIKRPHKLPVVLNRMEMLAMLNRPRLLKHRALIALLYGCGLRCNEVRNIKISDIDLVRSVLHVRQGKGRKDRYMPLGKMLGAMLESYIAIIKPQVWLFCGNAPAKGKCEFDRKFSRRGIQWAIHAAARTAGIMKPVNVHTLRHTFATHLLEDGVDIVSIKELLGHANVITTLIYLQVVQLNNKAKFSPLDNLAGVKIIQGIQCKIDFDC